LQPYCTEWRYSIGAISAPAGFGKTTLLTLVYMNNHWQGQAVGTARQLKMLVEGKED